jgi:hypothetical protein
MTVSSTDGTRIAKRIRNAASMTQAIASGKSMRRKDKFVTSRPSAQTALESVPDTWVSRFPPPFQDLHAGEAALFEDPRMQWALEQLGGVDGMRVVELGPLEGGHSYMVQQAGARHLIGVEANKDAFLKCLVTKEVLQLDRCSFLCGDVLEYLSAYEGDAFDVCVANGILYHMVEPVRLIDLISRSARRLVMWTHVVDERARDNKQLAARLSYEPQQVNYEGFPHEVYRYKYALGRSLPGYVAGTRPYTNWLKRDDLMRALEHFGWSQIAVGFDEPHHQNGASLMIVAVRDGAAPKQ